MTSTISFLQPSLFSSPSPFYYSSSARFRAMATPIFFIQPSLFRVGAFQFRIWQKSMASFQVIPLPPSQISNYYLFANMRIISPYRVAQTTAKYMMLNGHYLIWWLLVAPLSVGSSCKRSPLNRTPAHKDGEAATNNKRKLWNKIRTGQHSTIICNHALTQ